MKQLKFTVADQALTRTDTVRIMSDSIGQYEAQITIDDSWDGYIATVQYTRDGVTYDRLIDNGIAEIPVEVLTGKGQFHVHIVGNGAGGERITVNDLIVPVYASGWRPKSSLSTNPIKTIWDEIVGVLRLLTGGTAGQVLRKLSGDDYAAEWATPPVDFDAEYYTAAEADAKYASARHTHAGLMGTITEDFTPIESLSSGVYTLDGTGGTLMVGTGGECIGIGTVVISSDVENGRIDWIAIGRDAGWYYGVFLGQSVKNGDWWEPTYQIVPDFGELSETIAKKQDKPLVFSDITISGWAEDTTYTGYGYKATVPLTGATANRIPHVYFSGTDAISGNYAPPPESYDGGVYIYSKVDDGITVPLIVLEATS